MSEHWAVGHGGPVVVKPEEPTQARVRTSWESVQERGWTGFQGAGKGVGKVSSQGHE